MLTNQRSELKSLIDFFSLNKIIHIDDETTIIHAPTNSFLIKWMENTQQSEINLERIRNTLDQHQSFDERYILTLLHFEIVEDHQHTMFIRAIYQYSSTSLKDEIRNRREQRRHFEGEELWFILFSVVKALAYLEEQRVIYGVLGCDKIFIDERIRILDPSATALNPYEISENRLYSPELIHRIDTIDMFKSDVYVLGLCILEAGLLIDFADIKLTLEDALEQLEQVYDPSLVQLLSTMLKRSAKERPSFTEIKQFLEKELEMDPTEAGLLLPNSTDQEDITNEPETYETDEEEKWDALADYHDEELTEYEQARYKYIISSQTDNHSLSQTLCEGTLKYIEIGERQYNSAIWDQPRPKREICTLQGNGLQYPPPNTNNSRNRALVSKQIKDRLVKKIPTDESLMEMSSEEEHSSKDNQKEEEEAIFTDPSIMNLIESQFVLRESEHRGETEEGYECSMKSSQRFQLNTSSCWREEGNQNQNALNTSTGQMVSSSKGQHFTNSNRHLDNPVNNFSSLVNPLTSYRSNTNESQRFRSPSPKLEQFCEAQDPFFKALSKNKENSRYNRN